jgi:DNA-binding NtrC family response regulator
MSVADPVLVISHDKSHRELLADSASKHGLRPICCQTLAAAKCLLDRRQFGVVFCEDDQLDGHFTQLLCKSSAHKESPPVVVVSRRDDWDAYLRAMRLGAFDYVTLPPYAGEIERALGSALRESRKSGQSSTVTAA